MMIHFVDQNPRTPLLEDPHCLNASPFMSLTVEAYSYDFAGAKAVYGAPLFFAVTMVWVAYEFGDRRREQD